jgi:hypothetical protein
VFFLVFFCVFFDTFLGHFLSIDGLFQMLSCQLTNAIPQTNKKAAGGCLVIVGGFQGGREWAVDHCMRQWQTLRKETQEADV